MCELLEKEYQLKQLQKEVAELKQRALEDNKTITYFIDNVNSFDDGIDMGRIVVKIDDHNNLKIKHDFSMHDTKPYIKKYIEVNGTIIGYTSQYPSTTDILDAYKLSLSTIIQKWNVQPINDKYCKYANYNIGDSQNKFIHFSNDFIPPKYYEITGIKNQSDAFETREKVIIDDNSFYSIQDSVIISEIPLKNDTINTKTHSFILDLDKCLIVDDLELNGIVYKGYYLYYNVSCSISDIQKFQERFQKEIKKDIAQISKNIQEQETTMKKRGETYTDDSTFILNHIKKQIQVMEQ